MARVSGQKRPVSVPPGWPASSRADPARFFYRLRVHRRRKGERPSMSEADYAHLISAAHRTLNAPVIVIWDNLNNALLGQTGLTLDPPP